MKATIERMIREIEAYLAIPMRHAESFWENEERLYLIGLLEQLKEKPA
jgi:hypothetical protein